MAVKINSTAKWKKHETWITRNQTTDNNKMREKEKEKEARKKKKYLKKTPKKPEECPANIVETKITPIFSSVEHILPKTSIKKNNPNLTKKFFFFFFGGGGRGGECLIVSNAIKINNTHLHHKSSRWGKRELGTKSHIIVSVKLPFQEHSHTRDLAV